MFLTGQWAVWFCFCLLVLLVFALLACSFLFCSIRLAGESEVLWDAKNAEVRADLPRGVVPDNMSMGLLSEKSSDPARGDTAG